jgi:peptide chain release factor 1
MLDKLQAIYERFIHLEEQISDPEVILDMNRYKKVNKEYKDLKPIVEAYQAYQNILQDLRSARQALREDDDPEMQDLQKKKLAPSNPAGKHWRKHCG